MREYKYLDSLAEVKGVSKKDRTAELYVGVFNNVDLGNDILIKGSSAKTITERGPKGKDQIRHLWDHSTFHPIGRPLELYEDEKGIVAVTKFGTDSFSNDKMIQYDEGLIKFQSFGYSAIQTQDEKSDDVDVRLLQEIKLYEYSGVILPMNEEAGMKSLRAMESIELKEHLANLEKFLRNSKATDDTLMQVQSEVKRFSLLLKEPPKALPETEPSLLEIYNSLKN